MGEQNTVTMTFDMQPDTYARLLATIDGNSGVVLMSDSRDPGAMTFMVPIDSIKHERISRPSDPRFSQ